MQNHRIKMKLTLSKQGFRHEYNDKTITPDDYEKLGHLMFHGYKDTIDYEGESLEEFVYEMRQTLNGKYGPFLSDCSFLIEDRNQAVSAVIVSLFKGAPFVTYTVTHPRYLNRGYSTFLLKRSINALIANGYQTLFLMVTKGNDSAQHVYQKLGFVEVYGEWDEVIHGLQT
ncbi:MAG: GNAT family N-acetyltransferase [Bacillaceae bacterium]|nr:GNAT family N-acetyltransferase [Bacillaceae bacterium]